MLLPRLQPRQGVVIEYVRSIKVIKLVMCGCSDVSEPLSQLFDAIGVAIPTSAITLEKYVVHV